MYDEIIAFDHLANKAVIIQNIHKGDNIKQKYEELEDKAELILPKMERPVSLSKDRFTPAKAKVVSNLTKEQYEANVKKANEYIKTETFFQVVLSENLQNGRQTLIHLMFYPMAEHQTHLHTFISSISSTIRSSGFSREASQCLKWNRSNQADRRNGSKRKDKRRRRYVG